MKALYIPMWLYIVFAGVMIVALIYHWQHVLAYAPFIFILLCPLMHLFHGHGNREHSHKHEKGSTIPDNPHA